MINIKKGGEVHVLFNISVSLLAGTTRLDEPLSLLLHKL